MTDRTFLALAACQGMTDDDLVQRGTEGFKNMIERKRMYAGAARNLHAVAAAASIKIESQKTEIAKLHKELAQAKATITTLEQLSNQVTDTSEASAMLADLMAKKGE